MAEKKNPWKAVGIGCGVAAVIGLILMVLLVGWCKKKANEFVEELEKNPAKTTAEMVVRLNPDLELVSSDDESGTMTVLDKKSGKETTMSFEDIKEGKFTIETEDGTKATFDGKSGEMTAEGPDGKSTYNVGGLEKMPKWFEVPEGVTEWKSMMHQEVGTKLNGMVHGKTNHEAEDMFAALAANLETAGFKQISKTETQEVLVGSFQNKAKGQTIAVTINHKKAEKIVTITYTNR